MHQFQKSLLNGPWYLVTIIDSIFIMLLISIVLCPLSCVFVVLVSVRFYQASIQLLLLFSAKCFISGTKWHTVISYFVSAGNYLLYKYYLCINETSEEIWQQVWPSHCFSTTAVWVIAFVLRMCRELIIYIGFWSMSVGFMIWLCMKIII